MSPTLKWEYINLMKQRYQKATTKSEKSYLINEINKMGIYSNTKSTIRALNSKEDVGSGVNQRGRKAIYTDFDKQFLRKYWLSCGRLCSKRMKASLPLWLPRFECSEEVKAKLKGMATSTMDEFLKNDRADYKRKMNTMTRPQKTHIKALIGLRNPNEKIDRPGIVETDTVAHGGGIQWGNYAYTVDLTDIETGWTEQEMLLGRESMGVVEKLKLIEARLPFQVLKICFDGGTEFVNWDMVVEFKFREDNSIELAHGRHQKKNDQCHIEQKNNTHVRGLLEYVRIDTNEVVEMVNDLYRNEWSQLNNYFYPQQKLIFKSREGSQIIKKYDKGKTPCDRVLESTHIDEATKARLKAIREQLNPFELYEKVQIKLQSINKKIQETEEKRKAA